MKKKQTTVLEYIVAYLLWLVTVSVSVLVALVLREVIVEFGALTGWSRYTVGIVSQFSAVLLGLSVLAVLIITEGLYRTGVQRGQLLIRFCHWTGILLAIVGLAHLLSIGYRWQNSVVVDPLTPRLAFVEIGGAVILLWWRRIIRLRSGS